MTSQCQRHKRIVMLSSAEFHKDFLALRVATHEIGVNGFDFTHEISADALSALIFEPNNATFSWKACKITTAHFHLERENDHAFKAKVRLTANLTCTCVRCLNEVSYICSLDFEIRLLEMEHLGIDESTALGWSADTFEVDLSAEDEALVGYFSEKSIDLGLILRDQIFLQVPDYPHCGISNDALHASGCKTLPIESVEDEKRHNNPFVKLFGKTK